MRNRTTAIISRTARNPTGSTDGPTRGVLMDDRKTPSLLCRMIRIRSSLKAALAHISSVEVETGFFWLHSLGRKFTSVEQEAISGRAAPVPCHVVVRAAVAGGVRRVTCPPSSASPPWSATSVTHCSHWRRSASQSGPIRLRRKVGPNGTGVKG